jgi:hypothetical protein
MLFKERNNPFGKVIQPPNPECHPVAVILSNYSATEESLQRMKQLNIPTVLDNGEFGEYLKLAGHFWVRIDADIETTFAVNETHDPLSL